MWRERETQMGFSVGMGYVVHPRMGESSGMLGIIIIIIIINSPACTPV